ncbi:hypothetical protein [Guptibacillus spartinae]|uniref:hypothetical protein n=1 Tax=Guptibacillus spartinae TaxID=3025679 RepID=UPI002361EF13|nr:hypothetical protein [Pseudalkalibacillus spartinae]
MSQKQRLALGVGIGIAIAVGFNVGQAVTNHTVISIVFALAAGLLARVVGQLIIKK